MTRSRRPDPLEDDPGLRTDEVPPSLEAAPEPPRVGSDAPRPAVGRPGRRTRGATLITDATTPASVATGAPAAAPADGIRYIDDPVSKIWVGIIVASFALVFLNGIFLGRGGLATAPLPTAAVSGLPLPGDSAAGPGVTGGSASAGASLSPSPSGSGSTRASASPAASNSAAGSNPTASPQASGSSSTGSPVPTSS